MLVSWLKALKGLPLLAGAALLTSVSCSNEVVSPDGIKIDHLEPNVICKDFVGDSVLVKVHGDEFTPMPSKVLEDPDLVLPSIDLSRTHLIDGSEGDGVAINFDGTQGGTNADKLGWQKKAIMSMTFDNSNRPEEGIYDVRVTQPDETTFAELKGGFAVIPRPTITEASPRSLCNGSVDQTLTLRGTNFVALVDADGNASQTPVVILEGPAPATDTQSFAVDPASMNPDDNADTCRRLSDDTASGVYNVVVCTEVRVTIPANSLSEGDYKISLSNFPGEEYGCATDPASSITIRVYEEGPILFYADPPVVFNGINTRITLYVTRVGADSVVQVYPTGGTNADATVLDSAGVAGHNNRLQATAPKDLAAGTYDVEVIDETTGCSTVLVGGLIVTGDTSLTLTSITPPFGHEAATVSVEIAGTPFAATPRGFLNPVGATGVAIQFESITFVDSGQLKAVIPSGTPEGDYDVVVVNPDRTVGLLTAGYKSVADPPPVTVDVIPQSIESQADQVFTVTGKDFRNPAVSIECVDPDGNPDPAGRRTGTVSQSACDATTGVCTATVTVDGSGTAVGWVCIVRVTNTDGTYVDYSALGVTNPSGNLLNPKLGPDMLQPRRAHSSAAIKAAAAFRYVYAVGGDDGTIANASNNMEFASVGLYGEMRPPWVMNKEVMTINRTYHGGAQIGRYIYAVGGKDESGASLDSAERTMVLSPEEIPHIDDIDLCLSGGKQPCFGDDTLGSGLPSGEYAYRISAVIDSADPVNLGGETLASDPQIMKLPDVDQRGILVKLVWTAPLDSQGAELSGISGWRIYRTAAGGQAGAEEVLLHEITDPAIREYVDDGSATLGSDQPLPPGSTSAWQALPGNLSVPRAGLSAVSARDPSDPTRWYLYALLGEGLTSYELMPITLLPNGRQQTDPGWALGTAFVTDARSEFGAWVVDRVVSRLMSDDTSYIYLGPGRTGATSGNTTVDFGTVQAGTGQLDSFTVAVPNAPSRAGYGAVAASDFLFGFSGVDPGNNNTTQGAIKAEVGDLQAGTPPPIVGNFSSQGFQMVEKRYLLGASVQSAFIFMTGGQEPSNGPATTTTQWLVW